MPLPPLPPPSSVLVAHPLAARSVLVALPLALPTVRLRAHSRIVISTLWSFIRISKLRERLRLYFFPCERWKYMRDKSWKIYDNYNDTIAGNFIRIYDSTFNAFDVYHFELHPSNVNRSEVWINPSGLIYELKIRVATHASPDIHSSLRSIPMQLSPRGFSRAIPFVRFISIDERDSFEFANPILMLGLEKSCSNDTKINIWFPISLR